MLGSIRRGELSMRVLVTGGTGYIGCHTVAALAAQGHQVRLLVRARDRIAAAPCSLGGCPADRRGRGGRVTGARPPLIRWGLPSPTPWSGTWPAPRRSSRRCSAATP